MNDLISRQAALVFIQSLYPGIPLAPFNKKMWREKYKQYIEVEIGLTNLPSAEPKNGKWIGYNADDPEWQRDDGNPMFITCSECSGTVLNSGSSYWNFCPNCGTKMNI